jgi:hypothetical protein
MGKGVREDEWDSGTCYVGVRDAHPNLPRCGDGEAKFWLEPRVELVKTFRLSQNQLKEIELIIEEHYDELKRAWKKHFPG